MVADRHLRRAVVWAALLIAPLFLLPAQDVCAYRLPEIPRFFSTQFGRSSCTAYRYYTPFWVLLVEETVDIQGFFAPAGRDVAVSRYWLVWMAYASLAGVAIVFVRRGRHPSDHGWFYASGGTRQGPFDMKTLFERLLHSDRPEEVQVWTEGLEGWRTAGSVPAIARRLPPPLHASKSRALHSPAAMTTHAAAEAKPRSCPKCSLISPPDARTCDCGYDFVTGHVAAPGQGIAAPPDTLYRGVEGWLLLLCIVLVVFIPASTLYGIAVASEVQKAATTVPALSTWLLLNAALALPLAAFSVYAGFRLWMVRPGAVMSVKRFLVASVAISLAAAATPFLLDLPREVAAGTLPASAGDVFRAAVSAMVWFVYLQRSKRVRATYQD